MKKDSKNPPDLTVRRLFSDPKAGNPLDQVKWERRVAQLTDRDGNVIFKQDDVEVPETWSQQATNIVASKYFYGKPGAASRETSVRQLIDRVVLTIAKGGIDQGYFKFDDANYQAFRDELATILVSQRAAFNSPVWFNVGLHAYEPDSKAEHWHWKGADNTFGENSVVRGETGYQTPQCSACFINAVDDSMDGIMELARTEAMLFKYGSGTGTNFSSLRSSKETVTGGGQASGPLSFMKGLDAFAGVIKSGGKTRRAAKMAILNVDHPDIEAFIDCKLREEKKAWALMREGYDGSGPDADAYSSIFYQNANNSVRVSDEFMQLALEGGRLWPLKAVKDGRVIDEVSADDLLRKIAEAAHACGDPGMQFDTTINLWHTCPNSGRQNATNPCSEYSFLDDSSCNLASINLLKFLDRKGLFQVAAFQHTVEIMILAQDILVDLAGYPTRRIAENSHDFRPLGLGYANLGSLLMALGLPYDSAEGRVYAQAITALMTGTAYRRSAEIAGAMLPLHAASNELPTYGETGACPGWFKNQDEFLTVILRHDAAAQSLRDTNVLPEDLREAALDAWTDAYSLGKKHGYRNAQVTVLAPTGTIGYLMDCDTTGIEPAIALIIHKKLVGGGVMRIVNETVKRALSRLGYKGDLAASILKYIDETGTVEGSSLADAHLPVFDCAFKPIKGTRTISYLGHIRMMAAVQPFLSGAISKTVNLPEEASVNDVEDAFVQAWKAGLKAVAIYRDGSKKNQVLTTAAVAATAGPAAALEEVVNLDAPPKATRHRLAATRQAINHKIEINGHEGYLNIGLYGNGAPGEMFITMSKAGSTINGLLGTLAQSVSIALQHGVPITVFIDKWAHTRFEPSGFSREPGIHYAKSIPDYIARWMQKTFIDNTPVFGTGVPTLVPVHEPEIPHETEAEALETESLSGVMEMGDSPACPDCGNITVRNGSCYKCIECGGTTGCS